MPTSANRLVIRNDFLINIRKSNEAGLGLKFATPGSALIT